MGIQQGMTYTIKGPGRGAKDLQANVTGVVKRGRGYTVTYKVGKDTKSVPLAAFEARLVA